MDYSAECPVCRSCCVRHLDPDSTPEEPVYVYTSRFDTERELQLRDIWKIIDSISAAIWGELGKADDAKLRDVARIYASTEIKNLRKNNSPFVSKIYEEIERKDERIQALKADLDGVDGWGDMDQMRQERDEAIQKWSHLKKIIPKLLRNLDHLNSCGIWSSQSYRHCTCGMDALREELTAMGY
jgi:hypothetical protein